MSGPFSTWLLRTCAVSHNVTSSPVSVAGALPPALPDGPTNAPCGPEAPPASPSAPPVSKKAKRTKGTSGPSSSASLEPVGPLSLWESKLRRRLAKIGSTECLLTWKASATPAGRSLFRLVPSMRPIEEIDFGLWGTPTSHERTHSPRQVHHGIQLANQAAGMWPTPCSSDDRDRGRWEDPAIQRRVAMGKQVMLSMLAQGSGAAIDGPLAQTEKRGALNPAFVCWLMGFPPEWESCAPTAMPSSRKSRQKS